MHICLFLYLTEEMPLLLSFCEAGEVTSDHQMRVIQHCIEPTPGGQQCLYTHETMFVEINPHLQTITK